MFLWKDEAKYKSLDAKIGADEAALTSFGLTLGKLALTATPAVGLPETQPGAIREALLRSNQFVDLRALLFLSWSLGIPVVQLRVFPLDSKHMHAMTVESDGRFAILLGYDSSYAAQQAFTLAHELGHVFLNHFAAQSAIVDMKDPVLEESGDDDEVEANRFALELLTGHPEFEALTASDNYNSAQLASAATIAGEERRIDPGMIALSLGHKTRRWQQTFGALKQIRVAQPTVPSVNAIAEGEFKWAALSDENESYLRRVLRLGEPSLA